MVPLDVCPPPIGRIDRRAKEDCREAQPADFSANDFGGGVLGQHDEGNEKLAMKRAVAARTELLKRMPNLSPDMIHVSAKEDVLSQKEIKRIEALAHSEGFDSAKEMVNAYNHGQELSPEAMIVLDKDLAKHRVDEIEVDIAVERTTKDS